MFLGPARQVALTLGAGVVCGTGNFHGSNPIVALVVGSPGSRSFQLSPGLGGFNLLLQAIAFDNGPRLRLGDPLAATVHLP